MATGRRGFTFSARSVVRIVCETQKISPREDSQRPPDGLQKQYECPEPLYLGMGLVVVFDYGEGVWICFVKMKCEPT